MVLRTALVSALFATVAAQGTLDDYKQGKQDDKDAAAAAAAKEAKMAAVNKVITMLEDLSAQVLAEGEKEAAAYNKFACFCKDTTQEKSDAITKGEDDKSDLTARIESLSEKRDDLDEKIEQLTDDIATAEKELAEATAERHETLGVYEKNAADLEGALGLGGGADLGSLHGGTCRRLRRARFEHYVVELALRGHGVLQRDGVGRGVARRGGAVVEGAPCRMSQRPCSRTRRS